MITGVVLAKNEEHHIQDCLKSLAPYVEELFLIDMESSDQTVELAQPLVTRVLHHRQIANFDAARNIAIPEASHPWMWFLDADERVSPTVGNLIRETIQNSGERYAAITIPFKSYFCGKWIQHCGWWPGYTMPRVLRKGRFRFSERLHGGVEFQGEELRLPGVPELGIEHYSYRDIEHYLEKFNRYTSVESNQLAEQGQLLNWEVAFRSMVRDWWLYYEREAGQLEGQHGWILSWLAGQYRWFSNAKLLDRQERQLDYNVVPSLDAIMSVMESELARSRAIDPVLPLGIVWRSPVWDPSGYAEDSRIHLKSLAQGERKLQSFDIHWSDTDCPIPDMDKALFKALNRASRPKHAVTITNCIPTLVEPDPDAAINILRTTFETDRIPEQWLPIMDRFDEVWVFSNHDKKSFHQAGVAPEKLRVLGSYVDSSIFTVRGPKRKRSTALKDRFMFLSIFDWQLRKGWDVLLRAYCEEFGAEDGVGLLLKITRAHGHSLECIRQQAATLLESIGQTIDERPDIEILDESLTTPELAALYRSADAFVLSSRGEGWGRPYMEAMACGLPTIGTRGSGNDDFMTDSNSRLVYSTLVPVPEAAAAEISVYKGHHWLEPDLDDLKQAMRQVVTNEAFRKGIAKHGLKDVREKLDLQRARQQVEENLQAAEQRFTPHEPPAVRDEAISVQWEGELFANHSFANINEYLTCELGERESLALRLRRLRHNPSFDRQHPEAQKILRYVDRELPREPDVTVRHAFPPNWNPPAHGKWVHIQPWEYGALPIDWIEPLREQVDEIWAPSSYVKRIYEQCGIDGDKIHVIPWGVDSKRYHPEVLPRLLPTSKSFKFLFVGGSIHRKGIDWVLQAFTRSFTPNDDVCLVIKDMGTRTFYRYGNYREAILGLMQDPNAPEILYIDQDMTDGQRASLYAACDCLVAPYRGEGFGLPILEAMACGLSPIVPQGGASDDFVDPDIARMLPAQEIECVHDWRLRGVPTELAIELDDLMRAMRQAYDERETTHQMGTKAASKVLQEYSWTSTANMMETRIKALAASDESPCRQRSRKKEPPTLSLCLAFQNDEQLVADCIGRLRPFVNEIVAVDIGSDDRSKAVAVEYGARVYQDECVDHLGRARNLALVRSTSDWALSLNPWDQIADPPARSIREMLGKLPSSVYGVRLRFHEADFYEYRTCLVRNINDLVFDFRTGSCIDEIISRVGGTIVTLEIDVHRSCFAENDTDLQLELARRDLEEHPGHPDALFTMGRSHYLAGNFFHSECYLHEYLTATDGTHHRRDTGWLLLIRSHLNKGDFHRAMEAADKATEEHPEDSQIQAARQQAGGLLGAPA